MIYHLIPNELIEEAESGAHLYRLCSEHVPDLGVSERTCRRVFSNRRKTVEQSTTTAFNGTLPAPDRNMRALGGRKFVFTCAQSNTAVHSEFMDALEIYCFLNGASLVVGGLVYNKGAGDVEFDPRVQPYLLRQPAIVCEGLLWCGELNVIPTAVDPLSSLDSYTVGNSGIVPHTKVRLKSIPRMHVDKERFQYTTGCVTLRNYVQAKAGQRASFHHVYGALVVEIDDDGEWFARHIVCDSEGGFFDLNQYWSADGVSDKGLNTLAVTFGDVHFPNESRDFWVWVESMYRELSPAYVFLHDVYDFNVRNHHTRRDPFKFPKYPGATVSEEFDLMCAKLMLMCEHCKNAMVVVVNGNHDNALDRWLREYSLQADPGNSEFVAWCLSRLHSKPEFVDNTMKVFSPFLIPERMKEKHGKIPSNLLMLDQDQSYTLFSGVNKPIECGIHGHLGINGSVGTPKQFIKIGKRANTAHTHTASIIDGVYTAGTSTPLKLEYNSGLTTWSNSHIITYANGKRTIVTNRGEKWKANNKN